MSKRYQKLLSLLLCAVLLCGSFSMIPFKALAAGELVSGDCGAQLTWVYDEAAATLTVSGTGEMDDYSSEKYDGVYVTDAPWRPYYQTMKTVVIGDGVTSIGNAAFKRCIGLSSVIIGSGVQKISYDAFYGCTGLKDVTFGSGIREIGGDAFCRCSGLTNLTIPDSVAIIKDSAFDGCTGLTSVTLGSGVREIGRYAFRFCEALESIVIPDSVTSIGSNAFYYCSALENITLGGGVTSIGDCAFESTAYYKKRSNWQNGILYIGDCLIRAVDLSGEYAIRPGVKCIASYAFSSQSKLTGVTIPDSVINIGDSAFFNCTGLTRVTVPDSVTSIGRSAFSGCTALASVTVPDSLTDIGNHAFDNTAYYNDSGNWQDQVFYLGSCLLDAKKEIEGVCTVKPGVTHIGPYALDDCACLTGVILSDSVISIGIHAFDGCTSLTDVTIPDSVTSIGEDAFELCESLTSVTIPDSVTSIGNGAFLYCESLTSVTIPDSVVDLGEGVFAFCSNLTDVTFPKGITSIATAMFLNCTNLTDVTIPDSVTDVGAGAFYGCSKLTAITIPSGVVSIGEAAFCACSALTDITIPEGVVSVGEDSFAGVALTSVSIPRSLRKIGSMAFACGVFSMDTLTLTATLQHIEVDAQNPFFTAVDGVLYNKAKTKLIQYPAGNPSASFTVPDIVTAVGDDAFAYSGKLTAVTIPDSVKSIGGTAFEKCTALTSVTLGSGLESIGRWAFGECSALTSIAIPAGVTRIDSRAFKGCTALMNVIIPENVADIGEEVFQDCADELCLLGYPGSCAETYANKNSIPFAPLDNTPYVTLHCPPQTTDASFTAYGVTNRGGTVSVYDGGVLLGTATADGNGRWSKVFTLNEPADQSTHMITVRVTVDDQTASDAKTLRYDTEAILVNAFTLTHNGKTIDCLTARAANLTVVPSQPMRFQIKLNRSVSKLRVTGTKQGEVKTIEAVYDSAADCWVAEGWFDPANHIYVPDSLGLTVNEDQTIPFESAGITYLIDPSGYVYEAVRSNRVEGATAVIYYKADETPVFWEANQYEQDNPQTTDRFGAYHWDVTEGSWRVKVTKEGYETAYSDWMDVPPEWTEVALPLVCKAAPTVERVEKDGGRYLLTFSRYMDLTTVTTENITLSNGDGTVGFAIEPLDQEVSGTDSGVYYARTFALIPAAAVTDLTVKNVRSYAGVAMADEFKRQLETVPVQPRVKCVSISDLTLKWKSSAALSPIVSADAGAKYTVRYTSSDDSIVKVDENGEVTGLKTGTAKINVTVTDEAGHTVRGSCTVTVKYSFVQLLLILFLFGWLGL